MADNKFSLLSFSGKMKVLHLTWMAFFITFVVWFNLAPMLQAIAQSLGLTKSEIKTLLLLNVSLAIPARIVVGMLTDVFGPCRVYSGLIFVSSIPCLMFATAGTFEQAAIARFLLDFVGAGFVIRIRMVSEWFPNNGLVPLKASMAAGVIWVRRYLSPYPPSRFSLATTTVGATP